MMKMKILILVALLFSLTAISLYSQVGKRSPIAVKNQAGGYYKFPWAGGMNSCQFGKIDLDLDGNKDLVAFDRTGNRLMPFLNAGEAGNMDYQYAPEYTARFPRLFDWVIFVDFNKDGKEDIFTYSPGYAGMMVYKNVSLSELEFERIIYPYLTSFQGAGYTNILVTYVDYPGIADIDGDGDLDILTFWGLGSFVEMHQNLSYEKYGHYDSLDYEKTSFCWGYFAESEESNELTLDTCVGWNPSGSQEMRLPHTGSTFLLVDLDGDEVQDVLLGDVDYPNLVALMNGGTADSAHITSFELHFPAYDRSIALYSLPVASNIDIDNDGINDLLVSPFDPNPDLVENKFSSWFYRNTASNAEPEFHFVKDDFLQDEMIDVGAGSYPVLADYNGDGLPDLFVGNYGYYDSSYLDQYLKLHTVHTSMISLYQNIGSAEQPAFTYITDDFSGLSSLGKKGLVPSFADLDGDGDEDMLCGSEEGKVMLFENTAGQGLPMVFDLVDSNFENIDVGDYSVVQLFDLDKDGNTDMLIGERGGNINFYKGTPGNQWFEFNFITDTLGKVNVTDPELYLYGYSTPHFFRDNAGNTLLVAGSIQGELYFYTNIDDNLSGAFAGSDTLGEYLGIPGLEMDRGYQTAAVIRDLDKDGIPEMIAGNFSGGLEYFSRSGASPQVSGIEEYQELQEKISVYPNPASLRVDIDIAGLEGHRIAEIKLFDVLGCLVHSEGQLSSVEHSLDITSYSSGIYFLNIKLISITGKTSVFYRKLTFY